LSQKVGQLKLESSYEKKQFNESGFIRL